MGRTVTPFSLMLASEEARLKSFRRALRAEDQKHFDALFEYARRNIQAAVQAAATEPMESLLLLMLIEMHKEIQALRLRLGDTDEEEERLPLFALHESMED